MNDGPLETRLKSNSGGRRRVITNFRFYTERTMPRARPRHVSYDYS